MFRTEVVRRVGGFKTKVCGAEDYDLSFESHGTIESGVTKRSSWSTGSTTARHRATSG